MYLHETLLTTELDMQYMAKSITHLKCNSESGAYHLYDRYFPKGNELRRALTPEPRQPMLGKQWFDETTDWMNSIHAATKSPEFKLLKLRVNCKFAFALSAMDRPETPQRSKFPSEKDYCEAIDVFVKVITEKNEDLRNELALQKQPTIIAASEVTIDFGSNSVQG